MLSITTVVVLAVVVCAILLLWCLLRTRDPFDLDAYDRFLDGPPSSW